MERHIGRLKEEQVSQFVQTDEQIKQWEKFRDDYTHLQKRLKDLPKKVSYDVMVPLGPLAFVPGKLVHTNEILVLLGDNWFAEKSAQEACEVIDRRQQAISKTIEGFKQQKQLLESRLGFTSNIEEEATGAGGIVDIREDYDPDKEARWREERAKKRKESSKQKMKQDEETCRLQDETLEAHKQEEADLWARLDELERQEEELDELARLDEDSEEGSDLPEPVKDKSELELIAKKKTVKWKDDKKETNLIEEEEVEKEGEHEDDNEETVPTIHFSHSEFLPNLQEQITEEITSPADIYNIYQKKLAKKIEDQPKSILKPPSQKNDSKDLESSTVVKPAPQSIPDSAFSGHIVEHKSETVTEVQPKKRVSKFKQGRQSKGQR